MSDISVSIIVPFYDEVAFVETAVSSCLVQRIDGLEIIIVNDNPARFDAGFFARFGFPPIVRVVAHAENRGLSAARNTGIAAARGKWIGFLDADDFYLADGLARQLALARETGADLTHAQVVITGIGTMDGAVRGRDQLWLGTPGLLEGAARLSPGFEIVSSWSSLYRTDFLAEKRLAFDEAQRRFEDRLFILEALLAARSLAVLGEAARVWRRRAGSITTSVKTPADVAMKRALVEKCVAAWLGADLPDAREWAAREAVRQALQMFFGGPDNLWAGLADPGDPAYRALAPMFAGWAFTAAEIGAACDPALTHFAAVTGNGAIAPADMVAFFDRVAAGEADAAAAIIVRARGVPVVAVEPVWQERKARGPGIDAELFLHVGQHKTGTTAIQQRLAASREALKAEGLLFPETGFGFPPGVMPVRPEGLPGHQALLEAVLAGDVAMLDALAAEVAESGCRQVLISVENASFIHAPFGERREARVVNLLNALDFRGGVTPVALVRRPDDWIESLYRELVGNGAPGGQQSAGEFLVNQVGLLDLPAFFEPFERHAGRLRVAGFEAATAEGLAETLLGLCGRGELAAALAADVGLAYPAACNAQIEAARLVNALLRNPEPRREVLRQFFALTEATDQRGRLLSAAERRRAIRAFAASEGFLAERGLAVDSAAWLESVAAGEPEPVALPAAYTEALVRIGIWERLRPPALARSPRPEPDLYDPRAMATYPRPVRAFVQTYALLTHNRLYRRLRGFE